MFPVRDAQALHEKGMPPIEDQNRQITHDLRGEKGTHECCNDDAGKAEVSKWLWSNNPSSWRSSGLHWRQKESRHESQTKPAYRLRNHYPGPIASCEAYAPMALCHHACICIRRSECAFTDVQATGGASFEVVSRLLVVLSARAGEVLSPLESTYATPYLTDC